MILLNDGSVSFSESEKNEIEFLKSIFKVGVTQIEINYEITDDETMAFDAWSIRPEESCIVGTFIGSTAKFIYQILLPLINEGKKIFDVDTIMQVFETCRIDSIFSKDAIDILKRELEKGAVRLEFDKRLVNVIKLFTTENFGYELSLLDATIVYTKLKDRYNSIWWTAKISTLLSEFENERL